MFTICGGHLSHVTWTINLNFHSLFPRYLHIKYGFNWPRAFMGEDLRKWLKDDDVRQSMSIL